MAWHEARPPSSGLWGAPPSAGHLPQLWTRVPPKHICPDISGSAGQQTAWALRPGSAPTACARASDTQALFSGFSYCLPVPCLAGSGPGQRAPGKVPLPGHPCLLPSRHRRRARPGTPVSPPHNPLPAPGPITSPRAWATAPYEEEGRGETPGLCRTTGPVLCMALEAHFGLGWVGLLGTSGG